MTERNTAAEDYSANRIKQLQSGEVEDIIPFTDLDGNPVKPGYVTDTRSEYDLRMPLDEDATWTDTAVDELKKNFGAAGWRAYNAFVPGARERMLKMGDERDARRIEGWDSAVDPEVVGLELPVGGLSELGLGMYSAARGIEGLASKYANKFINERNMRPLYNRIVKSFVGGAEGAYGGAVYGGVAGEDPVDTAAMGGGFGFLGTAAFQGGDLAVKDAATRMVQPGSFWKTPGSKIDPAPLEDMFTPVPQKEGRGKVNVELAEFLVSKGFRIPPDVVRRADAVTAWFTRKLGQMTGATEYSREMFQDLQRSFKAWTKTTVDGMGENMTTPRNVDVGEYLQGRQRVRTSIMHDAANSYYTTVTEKIGFRPMFHQKDMGDSLMDALIARQKDHDIPRHMSKLIERLRDPEYKVTFGEFWDEVKKWRPDIPKGRWDESDYFKYEMFVFGKEAVKIAADDLNPTAGATLRAADGLWAQYLHEAYEDPIGVILQSSKPEKIVDELTSDISQIRLLRQYFNGTVAGHTDNAGNELVTKIAQRKVANILRKSINTGKEGQSREAVGQINIQRFNAAVESVGGSDAGLDGAYWEELLKDHPEVLKELKDLRGLLTMLDESMAMMEPTYESVGGGTEVQSITVVAQRARKVISLLSAFGMGRLLAKHMYAPPERNPFLGGAIREAPEGGLIDRASKFTSRAPFRLPSDINAQSAVNLITGSPSEEARADNTSRLQR